MSRLAIVTGALGQDGHYLTQELLSKGYSVVGTTHRQVEIGLNLPFELVRLDVTNRDEIAALLVARRPHVVFNLAARASSDQLFDDPDATVEVNGRSVLWWLEGIRARSPETRFCQASSCEVFAGGGVCPQDENTAYAPTSAYGAAKAFADHLVRAYRTTHGIFAGSAILYPHESPRRDPHFLVRKVVSGAVACARNRAKSLLIGNMSAVRDWTYAVDIVRGLELMMSNDEPMDFVLGSGVGHSVEDVCSIAFASLGLSYRDYVVADPALYRPIPGAPAIARPERAASLLNWSPSLSFEELVHLLVRSELASSVV
jgi:GDPmannose 4,6-dehydratase